MIRLFNHWFGWRTVLQVLFDFSFVLVGMVIAVLWVGAGLPIDLQMVLVYSVVLAVTVLLLNAWLGFYRRFHNRTVQQTRARAVLSLYLAVPIAYGLFLLFPVAEVSREFLQLSAMSAVFGMLVTRVSSEHATPTQIVVRRILVFGAGAKALAVRKALIKSDPTALIVGFYPSPIEEEVKVPGDQVLPRSRSLTETAQRLKVDEIVVAVTERRGGVLPLRELLDCKLSGVRVLDLASHFEQTLGQIRLDSLYAGWLIFGDGFRQGFWRTFVKRVFDVVCATILLLLAAPVMLVTAIAIALESGFPIIYRQERVGLNGRLFNVIKFRSMRRDAEKALVVLRSAHLRGSPARRHDLRHLDRHRHPRHRRFEDACPKLSGACARIDPSMPLPRTGTRLARGAHEGPGIPMTRPPFEQKSRRTGVA